MMHPPKWALKFIEWYCPSALQETIIGDVWEQYESDHRTRGKNYAKRMAYWNALRFMRPGILLRDRKSKLKINISMFKINIIIAFRSMAKNSFHSIINIVGLTLGMAFLILAYQFVSSEYEFDRFHVDSDRIYRLYQEIRKADSGETDRTLATMPVPLGPELEERFSNVQHSTRVLITQGNVKRGTESFSESILLVDREFFDVFDYPFLEGTSSEPFSTKNEIILSPRLAKKYFGNREAIGKNMQLTLQDSLVNMIVTGIVDPRRTESSLKFDLIIPLEFLNIFLSEDFMNSYTVGIVDNYIKLSVNNPGQVATEISEYMTSRADRDGEEVLVGLQPLKELHLDNELSGGFATISNPLYSYIFTGLGFLILVIATLNFVMLTSSHALTRTKEFGVRKTMGAVKSQLISQLITECLAITVISSVLAYAIAWFFLPVFNSLAGAELVLEISLGTILFVGLLLSIISIVAGLISSGFLVKLKPTQALKGELKFGRGNIARKVMVTLQFTFSVGLIIATFIFRQQMQFISSKDLGFDKNQLVELSLGNVGDLESSNELVQLLSQELSNQPEISNVSAAMNDVQNSWTQLGFAQEDGSVKFSYFNLITPEYIEVLGLEILEGRTFRPNETGSSIIVNETFVREFGLENPVSAQIPGKDFQGSHEIIGVIKDFHFSSLYEKIKPLMIACDFGSFRTGVSRLNSYYWPPVYNQLVIKSTTGNYPELENIIKSIWSDVTPDRPFSLSPYDDLLAKRYANDKRWSKVFDYAAIFSISIAWLGLIGLTQLTVKKRIKEIGIRKVLGSESWQVSVLLSRQFIWLAGISSIIAWPLAWYGLSRWLNTFEYKIDLHLGIFALTTILVIGITCLSVWVQTLKAARANPVKSLKVE